MLVSLWTHHQSQMPYHEVLNGGGKCELAASIDKTHCLQKAIEWQKNREVVYNGNSITLLFWRSTGICANCDLNGQRSVYHWFLRPCRSTLAQNYTHANL